MLTFIRIISFITLSLLYFGSYFIKEVESPSKPYVVCQMADWRDCSKIQPVSTTRAPLPQIIQHTSKTHSTTNFIGEVTLYQTVYTTITYDRTYYAIEKVTKSSSPKPSNRATPHSPKPKRIKEEPDIWNYKSPAEKANTENFVWFRIPFTNLRLSIYTFAPYSQCKILEYNILCWPSTQEFIDRNMRRAHIILGGLFIFFHIAYFAILRDSVYLIIFIFNRTKRYYQALKAYLNNQSE